MTDLKGSYTAVLALAILGLAGLAPRVVQRQVLDLLARKATAVMTNVPGPQQTLYIAGSRLKQMMVWVPQSGEIGVGVSILSYNGGVQFGLVTDKNLCAEPQRIIDGFAPEFEKLVYAVLLSPWDEGADPVLADRSLDATDALARAALHLNTRGDIRARSGPVESDNGAVPGSAADARPGKRSLRKRKSAFASARAAAQARGAH